MDAPRRIIFLCPHNAAKSVIAAAYFERLAQQRGLRVQVTSAGTEPAPQVVPVVVDALRAEGIDVSGHMPRRVTTDELATAWRIVSLGCELDGLLPVGTTAEHWDDVPAPSQEMNAALKAIDGHVAQLLAELDHETSATVPGDGPTGVKSEASPAASQDTVEEPVPVSLRDLCLYFLKLGALGFGGPIALAGYMRRDLAEQRHWLTHDEYQDGLAIAQTMPGPLAAQLAMWIGFIRYGVLGASLVGFLFILPPFLLVLGVAAIYDAVEGLSQIRALFYGIGPAAIAIITLAAWKLAKSTNNKDPKLWVVTGALMAITIITHSELAYLFIVAGLLGILVYAPPKHLPKWRLRRKPRLAGFVPFAPGSIGFFPIITSTTLVALGLFFLKAAAFTFGSGLAIVPFLHQGVVVEHKWLTEHQFLDAVAMGLITPGPVVIMATFVGYLAAGFLGALIATIAVFAPVWVFNVVIGRFFLRYRRNPQVRGFVKGATAAAVGAIGGAAVLLGHGAITDVWTVVIFAAALVILYFRKLKEPYVVGLAGLAGLLLYR